jgi:hypothetical protein
MIWTLYYEYGYFFGALLFGIFWILLFFNRKDLRKEILISSFCFSLLGISEIIFREYWQPKTLFSLVERFGVGIESFLLCFFLGGISAVLYEFIFRKREISLRHKIKNHHIFITGFMLLFIMLIFEICLPNYTIYTSSFLILFSIFIGVFHFRKDLETYIFEAGAFFMIFYILVLMILLPADYFNRFYNYKYLTGLKFLGIPAEEYLFGFAVGILGAFLYKFLYDKKVVDIKKSK